jgi:parallel beta-helix repeat protein
MKNIGHVVVILIVMASGFAGLLTITPSSRSQHIPHDPISINGDADFAEQAANEGWSGDGNLGNPYIIEGYDISAADSDGIRIRSTAVHFIIRDSRIENGDISYSGISLSNVTNGAVSKCYLDNNEIGIYVYGSRGNEIIDNIFSSNNECSIGLAYSTGITLINNRMMHEGLVILEKWYSQIEYWNTHTIDTSNTFYGKPVYYLKNQTGGTIPPGAGQVIIANCTNVRVENQELTRSSIGIQLGFSSNNTIFNNDFSSNSEYGISLYNSNNNTITNNNASNCGTGIYMCWYSNGNSVSNNIVSNNYYGVYLDWYSSRNMITNNTLNLNSDYGIYLYYSCDRNTIRGNTISEGMNGIHLEFSSGSTISNNTMIDNGIVIIGYDRGYWNTHYIDNTNTVNGKPVYCWRNKTGGVIPLGAGQIILVNCTNVRVENQHIMNTSIAIQMSHTSNNTIINNTVSSNNRQGIHLETSSSKNEIINNTISSNLYGIHLYSNGNKIAGNTIHSNIHDGIRLYSSRNSITNNTIYNNGLGINIRGGGNNITANKIHSNQNDGIYIESILSNNITGNMIYLNGDNGIQLYNSDNNSIISNNLSNNQNGIYVYMTSGNNIRSNTLSFNAEHGIYLYYSDCHISKNNASNNEHGISLFYSNGSIVEDNTANSNIRSGFYLYWSTENNISYNEATNNGHGILLEYHSADNYIIANALYSNNEGIRLNSSNGNNLSRNHVSNNIIGLYLHRSPLNHIIANNITSNQEFGIRCQRSNNNVIHHNNMIDNVNQLNLSDDRNYWDDGNGEGNFWSDYTGEDKDGDNVGDTNLPHLDVDNHPLMEPADITVDYGTVAPEEIILEGDGGTNYSVLFLASIVVIVFLIFLGIVIIKRRKKPTKTMPTERDKESLEQQRFPPGRKGDIQEGGQKENEEVRAYTDYFNYRG